jgi:hypothetical protein
MPKQKRTFAVEIEARLTVEAFDEDSARKKVERAMASGKTWGPDVETTDSLWTYAVTPSVTE